MGKEAKPWERQDGETPKQFEAFKIYRDMGEERSITKVANQLSKTRPLLTRWSSANNWVERCRAWDNEQDRLLLLEQRKEIKKMRKRHADIANAMLLKSAKALKVIPDNEIKPSDVAKMVDVASKLERISRGDVGEVVEQRDGGDAMSNVEIYKAKIPDNTRQDEDDFDDIEV